MASSDQVKRYLAYWFQLGKPLVARKSNKTILPQPVIQGNRYSAEFEDCWQEVVESGGGEYHLEGTLQSVEELLSSRWEITSCARCEMPVPTVSLGIQPAECPCIDLPSWPNLDLPQPRSPVNSHMQLEQIRERLLKRGKQSDRASTQTKQQD